MTKKTSETVDSQMERVGNAIKLEIVETIKDGQEAIVKADERVAKEFRRPRTA